MHSEVKKYKVIISQNAANMMLGHISFLAEVSVDAANNLREEFIKTVRTLEMFPERNPILNDLVIPKNKYRKMLVSKQYLLIYQISDLNIYLDYIVDCRRDYKWLLDIESPQLDV